MQYEIDAAPWNLIAYLGIVATMTSHISCWTADRGPPRRCLLARRLWYPSNCQSTQIARTRETSRLRLNWIPGLSRGVSQISGHFTPRSCWSIKSIKSMKKKSKFTTPLAISPNPVDKSLILMAKRWQGILPSIALNTHFLLVSICSGW